MRKIFVVIVTALVLALPSQAQINFGIKGGFNSTSMSFKLSELDNAVTNRSGFFVGPTFKFTFPIIAIGLDASVLYDQREGRLKTTGEKLRQRSIQIPVNARFGVGLGDFANVFIFLGPQFGFNFGGDTEKDALRDWSLKSAHINGNAGLGFMFFNHLQITANYNFAISNSAKYKIYSGDSSLNPEYVDVKNNAWQFALAYYF